MDAYTLLAELYDEFMDNVEYDAWCEFITKYLKKHGINDGIVLDLGCGTGTMTELLAEKGYDCIGVDSSAEMLEKALEKRDASGHDILYICQDMRSFELYGTARACVCCCDSINYLIEKEDILDAFKTVRLYLEGDGIFIFDFNTEAKFAEIGDATISEVRDDGAFIWENYYDPDEKLNEYDVTIFTERNDGLYERAEETHIERAYSISEIASYLKEAGFTVLSAHDGYTENPAGRESTRIVCTAVPSDPERNIY